MKISLHGLRILEIHLAKQPIFIISRIVARPAYRLSEVIKWFDAGLDYYSKKIFKFEKTVALIDKTKPLFQILPITKKAKVFYKV